jgi:hypothetical protein
MASRTSKIETQMPMRPYRLLALAALLLWLAASCSSSTTQTSRAEVLQQRQGDAAALLYQCALTRGLVTPPDPADQYLPHGVPPFVQGTKVVITTSNYQSWTLWIKHNDGVVLAHETLADWQVWAADNDKLPTAVCGQVSASALQKEVYAKYPAAAGDPWGT